MNTLMVHLHSMICQVDFKTLLNVNHKYYLLVTLSYDIHHILLKYHLHESKIILTNCKMKTSEKFNDQQDRWGLMMYSDNLTSNLQKLTTFV